MAFQSIGSVRFTSNCGENAKHDIYGIYDIQRNIPCFPCVLVIPSELVIFPITDFLYDMNVTHVCGAIRGKGAGWYYSGKYFGVEKDILFLCKETNLPYVTSVVLL